MPARVLTLEEAKSLTGQEIGASEWLTISQDMVDRFADLTLDRQWIHVDPERAKAESPFGATIAHGFLTLSLLSHFTHEICDFSGPFRMRVNYGLNRVRFVSPVRVGNRLRARMAVKDVEENGVVLLVTVDSEGGGKPALVAEWILRFY